MKYIDGGVTAAKGFVANGLYCGIKKSNNPPKKAKHKNDIGLLYCDCPCNTAAVYTQNKVKAAPVIVTKNNLEKTNGIAQAVIVNSKYANACNADGEDKAWRMCELAASALNIEPEQVIVSSTGVIGQVLPIEPIENCIDELAEGLSREKHEEIATAIMTTDTVKKEYAVEFELDGKTVHIGGIAKGSGMIHPNMATTLNFITTDAAISQKLLQKALSEITKITYNCLSIDGDMSTNDMVVLMSSAQAENREITEENEDYGQFKDALYEVMMNLTKMLAKDGEGASKLLECVCSNAPDLDTAIIVAKEVIASTLVKCAMFGEDANCGRILCAIGYTPVEVDINNVAVSFQSEFGTIEVCRNGLGLSFSEDFAAKVLSSDEIKILVNLNQGNAQATAWGCDMTYDYVKINGDYRT